MARLLLVVALSALVAACARFPGFPPTEDGVLSYDWVPADPRPEPAPLYCYQTLGKPECYATPVPGRLLSGNYGAPPPILPARQAEGMQLAPAAAVRPAAAPEAPPPAVPLTPVETAPIPLAPKAAGQPQS